MVFTISEISDFLVPLDCATLSSQVLVQDHFYIRIFRWFIFTPGKAGPLTTGHL
jgi:hypothetical protein